MRKRGAKLVPLSVNNEQEEIAFLPAWEELLVRVGEEALKREGAADAEVSVTLVDDARIQELNRTYRGLDEPTDVLSFALREGEDSFTLPPDAGIPELLGDVVISLPRARSQAAEYGHSLERELGYLLTHGILHLLGYDHETEEAAAVMRAKEEEVLAAVGLSR
ncbi:MAG: putative rRNA maturation factor [Bacillota bacterium]|nr:putative rRNA maturation factor [Bacillota bacterium]